MPARPFPYERLPKLSRRQQALLSQLHALFDEENARHALQVARGLLGRDLQVRLGVADSGSAQELAARSSLSPGVALLLEHAHSARPTPVGVELSHHAAQQVVDRALGGENVEPTAANLFPLDELSRGALAYVIARVLAALGGRLSLCDITDLSRLAPWLADSPYVVWPLLLSLGRQSLTVRVYLPEHVRSEELPERIAIRDLSSLKLELSASAGVARLTQRLAASLLLGDVVVLDESRVVFQQGRARGELKAALPGSHSFIRCTIADDGLRIDTFHCSKDRTMTTGNVDTTADLGEPGQGFAADTPIEMQVEVARFSLSFEELQRLRAGDVLVTGRRIGERVVLRISGRSFAEGELVDVEGEIGVRLLSFTTET
jgi:type III secretion system YscQ/HrcQ family protein